MDRVHDARAGEERAEEREVERERDEHHVPDLQHPAFLLDHHRVEERGRGEPRHQRRVLDRIPGVVAAPADLDVRPVGADQLPDAEERPRGERPAARGDDPALVGAAGEERAHRERERNGEPDVAEVQERRVGEHVRVLEARDHPSAVHGRRLDAERARDEAEHEREEDGDQPEDRHRPGDQLPRAAVEPHGEPRVAREHEQPEQQRAFLAAPEGRERVSQRKLVARVLPDVDEGHVAAPEGDEQDDGSDERHRESRQERVLGREREPAAPLPRSVRAGYERVGNEPKGEEKRGAPERRH